MCRCKHKPVKENYVELEENLFRLRYPYASERTINAYRKMWGAKINKAVSVEQFESLLLTATSSLMADEIDNEILEELIRTKE